MQFFEGKPHYKMINQSYDRYEGEENRLSGLYPLLSQKYQAVRQTWQTCQLQAIQANREILFIFQKAAIYVTRQNGSIAGGHRSPNIYTSHHIQ